jgi:hypothetical protein
VLAHGPAGARPMQVQDVLIIALVIVVIGVLAAVVMTFGY